MSEISSGLVAVAEVAFSLHLGLYAAFVGRRQIEVGDKLVRLSDAEAIIAKLSSKDRYGVCDECGTPYSFDPTDGGTICVKCQKDKIAQKDAEILEQCRINGMGAEREAALLGKVAQQSAALKLARQALTSITEKPRAYEGIRMASQALAAIDALKGE